MPKASQELSGLERYRQVTLTVTGRKSGRPVSHPVWFVLDQRQVYLLPVRGSDTLWYKNVLKDPHVSLEARGVAVKGTARAVTAAVQVAAIVARFRERYGAADVKKYYSGFDVAVVVPLG